MNWYEPGEDTYTLIDVLKKEMITGKCIIDLGCSTGAITDELDMSNLVISIDLNTRALEQLVNKNAVRSDLLIGINQSTIDVCVFNPPYVPDFDCVILGGGECGRSVIDEFIEMVEIKLVYLLVIAANKPQEVKVLLEQKGYEVTVLRIRKVLGETIIVFKAVMC